MSSSNIHCCYIIISTKLKEKHILELLSLDLEKKQKVNKVTTEKFLKLKKKETEKNITQGNPTIRLSAHFSPSKIFTRQKQVSGYISNTEREKSTTRLLYATRISFKIDGEIKSFSNKQKLREFSATKLALQHILKGLIQSRNTTEEKLTTKSTPQN